MLPILSSFILKIALAGTMVPATALNTPPPFVLPETVTQADVTCRFDAETRFKAKVYSYDLTGDQEPEYIVRMTGDRVGADYSGSATMVFMHWGDGYRLQWVLIAAQHSGPLRFDDLTGDGVAELVLVDYSGAHYRNLSIISWNGYGFAPIFRNGTACSRLEVDATGVMGLVVIGRENWKNPDFCYATSGDLSFREAWRWNGSAFRFSPRESDLARPISEGEAMAINAADFSKKLEMFREFEAGE